MNLIKCYEEQPKIPNLSEKVIIKFQAYLDAQDIPVEKYYESITPFVDELPYSNSTKKGYRNRLRRFLYQNDIK